VKESECGRGRRERPPQDSK
jgi:hypothetical protein